QRKRLEDQYTRSTGMLLAGLSGSPISAAQAPKQSLPNLDALAQFEPAYLLADGGKIGFVLTRLKNPSVGAASSDVAIARLRQIIKIAQLRHPHVWMGVTGIPVLEHDQMAARKFDM